jgi:hypothetical protein
MKLCENNNLPSICQVQRAAEANYDKLLMTTAGWPTLG